MCVNTNQLKKKWRPCVNINGFKNNSTVVELVPQNRNDHLRECNMTNFDMTSERSDAENWYETSQIIQSFK